GWAPRGRRATAPPRTFSGWSLPPAPPHSGPPPPRAGLVLHGYHWPLDVVAGWCLSGVLLLALRAVTRSGQLPK
ncbi:hypothetical protein ACFW0I_19660, partial [[Kitasatospora] papulosa]